MRRERGDRLSEQALAFVSRLTTGKTFVLDMNDTGVESMVKILALSRMNGCVKRVPSDGKATYRKVFDIDALLRELIFQAVHRHRNIPASCNKCPFSRSNCPMLSQLQDIIKGIS